MFFAAPQAYGGADAVALDQRTDDLCALLSGQPVHTDHMLERSDGRTMRMRLGELAACLAGTVGRASPEEDHGRR